MDEEPAARADVPGESPAPLSSSPPVEPPVLGVLFVHGLGSAQRGDTLAEAGEPFVNWLRYWIKGGLDYKVPDCKEDDICLKRTHLSRPDPAYSDRDVPAYTILEYTAPIDGKPAALHRWIMAECWWAEDFPQAKFSNLWNWALGAAPWLLAGTATNIINQIQRVVDQIDHMVGQAMTTRMRNLGRPGDIPRSTPPISSPGNSLRILLLAAARAVMSFFLLAGQLLMTTSLFLIILLGGVLAELLIFALVVLSFVPPVRSLVVAIQEGLAGNFGDGYMIAASPLSLDAMITQVRHDLNWLKLPDNCGPTAPIAVVAHSGGAAVSYHALHDDQTPPVQLLVTYGNGLSKLEAVRQALGNRGLRFACSAVLRLAAVLSLLTALVPVLVVDNPPWLLIAAAFVVCILLEGASQWLYGTLSTVQERGPELSCPKTDRWMDFYSAADPAPNGPLKRPDDMPEEAFSSSLVTNLHSVSKDHGQYWFNNEQFLSRVTGALSELAGSGPLLPEDEESLASAFTSTEQAARQERAAGGTLDGAQAIMAASAGRRIRTFLYMVTGLLAFLELPILWIAWGQWVYTTGSWLGNPLLGTYTAALGPPGESEPTKLATFVSALVGMLLVAIVVIAYENLVLFSFWREWSAVDTDAMFGRRVGRGNVWLKLVFLTASIVVPALVVVSVLTGFATPPGDAGEGDGVAAAWLAVLNWLLGGHDGAVRSEVAALLSVVTWALAWAGLLVSVAIAWVGAYLGGLGPTFLAAWEQQYGQSEEPKTIKEMMIRTRLGKRLELMATGRTIAWLALLFVLFTAAFLFIAAQLAGHVVANGGHDYGALEIPRLDLLTPSQIFDTIRAYGDDGRALYIWSCSVLDSIFPLVYGLLLVLIFFWLAKKAGGKAARYITALAILPLAVMALDYLENATILTMLTHYPLQFDILERAQPILTNTKWEVVLITIVALLMALLVSLVKRPAARGESPGRSG